ncbi:hydroxylysine kinase [Athalia rosae]|uniref:hydroxylysine kinase n=1 Tax=Athalia rosae TaxID=37344 RepID=UPI0020335307|nr:hydroxylysine kinase [Athalia rosae]
MQFNGGELLQPGQIIRPNADTKIAIELVNRLYGLKVKQITELNAYDDKNFHVICEEYFRNNIFMTSGVQRDGYVLKITNSLDSRNTDYIEGQTEVLLFLNEKKMNAPCPVKNIQNLYYSLEMIGGNSNKHAVRLLTYKPGKMLMHSQVSDELLENVGEFAARLDKTLENFHHPAYDNHVSLWMLNCVPKLKDFVFAVKDTDRISMVNDIISRFEVEVIKNIGKLETGIIHGDLNEQNILVNDDEKGIRAVLDVGDSHNSCYIFEIAITMCYMLLQTKDIARGKPVLVGYQRVRQLPFLEKKILKTCVCARICQSLVLGAYSHMSDPENNYLLATQKPGWILLEKLWPLDNEQLWSIWE